MNLNKWKLPGTNSDFNSWAAEWEKLSEPLAPLQQQLQELKAIAQTRLEAEAQAEADKMAFTGNNRTAVSNMLAGHEIGDIVEFNGKQYEVVKQSGHTGRNQGNKKLRLLPPAPGPSAEETYALVQGKQQGDIVEFNGQQFEVRKRSGHAARNQSPLYLVPVQ